MPPMRQLVQLTEAREQAKQKRIEVWQTDIFEDESIEESWVPENEEKNHKNLDWKDDSEIEMTDDDDVLHADTFFKLLKAAQNQKSFDSLKILF